MYHEFIKKKLGNGLTILFEKRKLPVVSIASAIKQGFAYETEKEKGISHFVEHLMFKGTKTRTYKQIGEEIEKKGGILNAFTGEEVTSYWNKVPNKYVENGLDISSDLILNPKFDKKEFEKEKGVILEEIKMYRDNPQVYVIDKIKELLYKKPFGMSGIGTVKSVSNISHEDILRFYDSKYKTNKMILCVVGNTSLGVVDEWGEKFPKNIGKVSEVKPVKINKKIIEKRKGIDQANYVFGFHTCSLRDKRRYDYEVFNTILAEGMSSKLFDEIREKRGLAYAVKGYLEQGNNFGYEMIYVGTTKDKVKACEKIIIEEIKKMKNLSQRELSEGKEKLIGLRKVGSEESVNVMNWLIQEEIAGDAKVFYKYEDKISQIKLEDVRNISKIRNYSSISLIPS